MRALDPLDEAVWNQVHSTVGRSLSSSMHCSIATVGEDGHPHVTPIGSVMLTEPGKGVYLDVMNVQLGRNLDRDQRLTLLAVDSSRRTWLHALARSHFATPPGVRLTGTAGPARPASDAELARFRRRVSLALRTKGGRQLWGGDTRYPARDLTFSSVVPVHIPRMTRHLWPDAS